MADINILFSDLLDEMELLSQSIEAETSPFQSSSDTETISSIGFTSLNAECLHKMEECDLDALVASLAADLTAAEQKLTLRSASPLPAQALAAVDELTSVPPRLLLKVPSPQLSTQVPKPPLSQIEIVAQTKAEKMKLALEKLKEAKIKKLIIKVLLSDGSSKTLMVDGRQTARDVLDCLFEKTHCDRSVDWSLCETNPHLQIERAFEDHECLVEHLSSWSRDTENQLHFLRRSEKYEVFREPQMFYLWKKRGAAASEKEKQILIKESFQGTSVSVPDLEGALFLKESGKKTWKRRCFILRASGIYYVQKGKTKLSSDLACFVQFDHLNVYYSSEYKHKYRAPTDFCFVLKHPQIQKESEHVRVLCCDDQHSLSLWVTSIRIAKYGQQLFRNYQIAVQRASASTRHVWLSQHTTATSTTPEGNVKRCLPVAVQPNENHAVTPATCKKNFIPPATNQTQSLSPIEPQLEDDLDEPPPDFVPPSPPGRRSTPSLNGSESKA